MEQSTGRWLMPLVPDPLQRHQRAATLLICIRFAAPLPVGQGFASAAIEPDAWAAAGPFPLGFNPSLSLTLSNPN
jgi:hypothetical protein